MILAEEEPKVPEQLIEVVEEGPGEPGLTNWLHALVKRAWQPIPWFYWDSGELQSAQQSFFGVYAARNTLRGVFLSLGFIQAGDLLLENDFVAASIFLYYTASFHLLKSLLALNGRIVIEPALGAPKLEIERTGSERVLFPPLDEKTEVIVAKLTRRNTWKFEPRSRDHATRWKELEPVLLKLGDNIPDFFLSFFKGILFCEGYYIIKDGRSIEDVDNRALIQDGLKLVPQIRHRSIYIGYGHGKVLDYNFDVGKESRAYRDFAVELLTFCVSEFVELQNSVPSECWGRTRGFLTTSMLTPVFEIKAPELAGKPELSKILEQIWSWLAINTAHRQP